MSNPNILRRIRKLISDFYKEQQLILPDKNLLNEISMSFKDFSEFEIRNIRGLALSDNGTITRSKPELFFIINNRLKKTMLPLDLADL